MPKLWKEVRDGAIILGGTVGLTALCLGLQIGVSLGVEEYIRNKARIENGCLTPDENNLELCGPNDFGFNR